MLKGRAILLVAIAAAIAVSPNAVSAKGNKSTSLSKGTVTGKHYDKITLTPNSGSGSSKPPVAKKPTANTAAAKTTKPVIKLDGVEGEAKDTDHKEK